MLNRRQLLATISATGLGTSVFHEALAGLVQETENQVESPKLTAEMVKNAEWMTGTEFTDEEREEIAASVNRSAANWRELRNQRLEFGDLPAMHFQPLSGPIAGPVEIQRAAAISDSPGDFTRPASDEELAWLPVTRLAFLVRTRQVSSAELTRIYLERLKKYNPLLNCVVTITEELALSQAARADEEIGSGKYRGPLHGIPWGAKDLIAVPGYPTTWGIPQFENREIDSAATVFTRLEEAGAVLVAKLSLGAIAMGDQWFRGMTRSPWNYKLGSSGSSAGSASATVAGLVGFSLGSETLGSIVSPSRRCGANGFRPTFGRVSRAGCMPLSWSMDKIGPITRSVEDAALVFAAIHGADGVDPTVADRPFTWPVKLDFASLRVGYMKPPARRRDNEKSNSDGNGAGKSETEPPREDLEILKRMGCQLVEIELPPEQNQWTLADIIDIEAASVFDDMLRARQTGGWNTWPGTFRAAQFISAIDYLRLLRRRRQLQFRMEELMETVDFLVNCNDLLITNLTGHPSVVVPQSFREADGRRIPVSTLITGRLNDDDRLLALAMAFQNEVTAHREHPPLDALMEEMLADQATGDMEKADGGKGGQGNSPQTPKVKQGKKSNG